MSRMEAPVRRVVIAAALATLLLAACQSMPGGMADKSLYQRLGGQPAIVAVVTTLSPMSRPTPASTRNSPLPTFHG